jgi:hypothetical protein
MPSPDSWRILRTPSRWNIFLHIGFGLVKRNVTIIFVSRILSGFSTRESASSDTPKQTIRALGSLNSVIYGANRSGANPFLPIMHSYLPGAVAKRATSRPHRLIGDFLVNLGTSAQQPDDNGIALCLRRCEQTKRRSTGIKDPSKMEVADTGQGTAALSAPFDGRSMILYRSRAVGCSDFLCCSARSRLTRSCNSSLFPLPRKAAIK